MGKEKLFRLGSRLALVSCSVALLAGAPDGCNELTNVGIVNTEHIHPSSPDAPDSTYYQPFIVTRDNPSFGGAFVLNKSGAGSDSSGIHGKWNNLYGLVALREYKKASDTGKLRSGPFLPARVQQSPGEITWASRFGDLVHDTVFGAELNAFSSQEQVVSNREFFVKLSKDVALVPVVIISWRPHSSDNQHAFLDYTHAGKNMFDFVPYYKPEHAESEYSPLDVQAPNQMKLITDPSKYQTPPDDIWDQCNVQFQVVATYVFDLPQGWSPNCSTNFYATLMNQTEIENRIRQQGPVGQKIVDDLQPVYLSYGDFGDCTGCMSGCFVGKMLMGTHLIEVHNMLSAGYKRTTAHELGHILGLHDLDSGDDNLMLNLEPQLTATQCQTAHHVGDVYSDRYRQFNIDTGRTLAPPVFAEADDTLHKTTKGILQSLHVCCSEPYLSRSDTRGGYSLTGDLTLQECEAGTYNTVVDYDECLFCCATGDAPPQAAKSTWIEQCEPADRLEENQCDLVCCTATLPEDNSLITRYGCETQLQGQAMAAGQCSSICCSALAPDTTTMIPRYTCEVEMQGHEVPCDIIPPA